MKRIFLCLVLALFLASGCTKPSEAPPTSEPTLTAPTKFTALAARENITTVEAQGVVIRYQRQSFWDEDDLSIILQDKDEFSSYIIAKFVDDISKYGKQAINANIEFNEDAISMVRYPKGTIATMLYSLGSWSLLG